MIDEYYTRIFVAESEAGVNAVEAGACAARAYLDGRPRTVGGRRTKQAERDLSFSASPFLKTLPPETWFEDALVLALGRLVGQHDVAIGTLLEHVARVAPAAARQAVRVSGVALRRNARHRCEVARLAVAAPDEFEDFNCVLDTIVAQCRDARERLDRLRQPFAEMSPVALLAYASLYAFKHVVPLQEVSAAREDALERFWRAVTDVLAWKLKTTGSSGFRVTERDIGKCFGAHLSPWLFPTPGWQRRTDLLAAFEDLMDAESELQEAERAAEVFCYDDAADFVRDGDRLEFVIRDPDAQAAWRRADERLGRLQRYWYMRGMAAFVDSPIATEVIGRPENHEWNRTAHIKAMATQLRLGEVYGVGDTVSTGTGQEVPLFKAVLTRELVAAFGQMEFVQPYRDHLARGGDWAAALGALALGGLANGMQNRLPVTFSRREDKIRNIVGWTVSADRPRGSRTESKAIVDFWTSDWSRLAERLRRREPGLVPELFERPFLKLGQYLFELPWVSAFQNNQHAVINNLRRLGSRRGETGRETRRIEERLASLFRERGFEVRLNWEPDGEAGEVDLVCARDGGLLVLEVKSSYMRGSLRDAWLHGTMTLRRAGDQLRRKVPAVVRDAELVADLAPGLASQPPVHAWIVDTSIEHDHDRFGGFLKISVEELIIALRDERSLLDEADRVFGADSESGGGSETDRLREAVDATLYPGGFTFAGFVDVIESASVWKRPGNERAAWRDRG